MLLKHHLFWGVGLGAAAVASTQILTWMGLGLTYWTWVSSYVLVVVFAVVSARSLRKRLGGSPGLVRAAGLVLVIVLVSNLMWQTYMFVYINFIDPNWVDMVSEFWSGQLREGGTTEDEIATTIANFRRQWKTSYVFTLGIIQFALPLFVVGFVAAVAAAVRPRKARRDLA